MTSRLHLAQVNIARMRASLESPVMAGVVARLDEINALADRSPGFVWRLQTGEGNATYPSSFAFTFKATFPPDPAVVQTTDWSAFEPCPAV